MLPPQLPSTLFPYTTLFRSAASLLGYEEYNDGETEEFSGVVAEDDYTVIFKFQEPSVTPEYIANFPIIPKHVFEDIPVIDIPEAAASLEPGEVIGTGPFKFTERSEEHTSELQSRGHLVCRLLLEKNK